MKLRRLECLLVAGLASLAWLAVTVSSRAADQRPNIVFILADDLGYTDVACYGSKYYETPNIDRMAANGIRFTSGYTCGPNCAPTRAALMSGQYGPRTGVYTVGSVERFDWRSRPLRPVDNVTQLPLSKVTLAQSLKKAGYATAMFGKWHLGDGGEYHPGQRGFDEAIVSAGVHFDFVTHPPVEYPKGTYLADFLTDKAVDFIRRHKEGPFFLYLPHFAVHKPLQAKEDLIAKFKPKPPVGGHNDPTYAAMIASVDESVGRVLALLDELKLADKTLVIFSSDNGGVGGYVREGVKTAGDVTDNAPLRGGKGMLYEGGIRVPYIFRWPGKIPAGTRLRPADQQRGLVSHIARSRWRRAACQLPAGWGELFQIADQRRQGLARPRRDLLALPGLPGRGRRARGAPLRPVPSAPATGSCRSIFEDGRLELYNLRDDLSQKNNLAAAQPDKVKELHARLTAWRKAINAPMPTKNTEQGQPAKAKKGKKKKQKSAASDQ